MRPLRSLLAAILFFSAAPALAGDGVVEINQTCANVGCFCGDDPFLPVTITGCAGRNYRLTSDLDMGLPVVTGILISAPDVRLDLGGFSIHGLNVCNGNMGGCVYSLPGSGIEVIPGNQGPPDRVRIENGSVAGAGSTGIFAGSGNGHLIRNVRVAHNALRGIDIRGTGATVADATASLNGQDGIFVGVASRIADCVSFDNGLTGIVGAQAVLVSRTSAYSNGSFGIEVWQGSSVTECVVRDNGGTGVFFNPVGGVASEGVALRDCVVSGNGGAGVTAWNRALVTGNSISDNDSTGLSVLGGGAYGGNSITSNGSSPVQIVGGSENIGSNHCTNASDVVVPCP